MDHQPIKPTLPARVSNPAQTLVRPVPASNLGPARKAASRPVASTTPADKALRFRPVVRPPMAVLEILDDGRDDGECIRIRLDSLTIGRTTGDVILPHDGQLSSSHARISRRIVGGAYRWYLTDLGSTNGTFVRAAKAKLSDGRLLILGSFRYRLRSAGNTAPSVVEQSDGTRGWRTVSATDAALAPSLVRLNPDGTEQAFPLIGDLVTLGQSLADCSIVLSDDPAVSSLHARFRPLDTGQFQIEDAGSLNGIWFGIQEHPIESTAEFQLGEQRFRLRVSP